MYSSFAKHLLDTGHEQILLDYFQKVLEHLKDLSNKIAQRTGIMLLIIIIYFALTNNNSKLLTYEFVTFNASQLLEIIPPITAFLLYELWILQKKRIDIRFKLQLVLKEIDLFKFKDYEIMRGFFEDISPYSIWDITQNVQLEKNRGRFQGAFFELSFLIIVITPGIFFCYVFTKNLIDYKLNPLNILSLLIALYFFILLFTKLIVKKEGF